MIVTIILAKADSFDFLLPPAKAGGILNEWLLIYISEYQINHIIHIH